MKRDDIYLEHILKAFTSIQSYIDKRTEADFMQDAMVQDDVIRQFEVIGEATK